MDVYVQNVEKGDFILGQEVFGIEDDGINTTVIFVNGHTQTYYTGTVVSVERK